MQLLHTYSIGCTIGRLDVLNGNAAGDKTCGIVTHIGKVIDQRDANYRKLIGLKISEQHSV